MCVCACLELNPEPHMLSTGSPTELHHPPPQVLMLFNVLFNKCIELVIEDLEMVQRPRW
jgi:hypothetical protein